MLIYLSFLINSDGKILIVFLKITENLLGDEKPLFLARTEILYFLYSRSFCNLPHLRHTQK